ncbi:MAG: YkvA family protein [Proteobacteria bacterium]|nr:YkvA family protein [Pseudomonadota bacterium]
MSYEKNLNDAAKSAEKVVQDSAAVELLAEQAHQKARKAEGKLKGLKKDLDVLVRLARAWATGKYRDISWASIAVVVGAVIYFVNPFDALPDFFPLIGFSDDLSVIGFAVLKLRRELDKFNDWENEVTLVAKKKKD